MFAILAPVLGLALLDSLNPTLFVAQLYLMTTTRPLARLLSYVGGVLTANFAAGLLVLGGLRSVIANFFDELSPVAVNGGLLALGLALVVYGLTMKVKRDEQQVARTPKSLHPFQTYLLGLVVMANEATTALPYFVAIERMVRAGLDALGNLFVLSLYNLVFIAPLLLFVALFVAYRDRFTQQLERFNRGVARWLPRITKWLLLVAGVALLIYGGYYLVAGRPLFG
jgi:cytochrome c biogenesis protein CcdA